jgi:hypothetical protein
MLFIAEAYDISGNRILGSDGSTKFDLKTVRGAEKRVGRFLWNNRTKEVRVFRVPWMPYFSEDNKQFSFSVNFNKGIK